MGRPIATITARRKGSAVVCEGTRLAVSPDGASLDGFKLNIDITWTDTLDRQEVHMAGSMRLAWNFDNAVMSSPRFQRFGNAVLERIISILLHSFAHSFAADYERWASDESYR